MTQASCKTTINMSADAIWLVICRVDTGDFNLPEIVTCKVEGEGIGSQRTAVHGKIRRKCY